MKLPTPRKRSDAYRIEIMIKGKRHSATRDTARECKQWAASKLLEHKSSNGQTVKSDSKPPYLFKQLFDEYWDKVGKHSKSKNWILP